MILHKKFWITFRPSYQNYFCLCNFQINFEDSILLRCQILRKIVGCETKKKVIFRNNKINFEIRNIFRKGSKKYRMSEKNSKKKVQIRSLNYFKIKNFWDTILFLGQIDYEEFKFNSKTWSRDHRKCKSRNNHFASKTLLKYLGPWSLKGRSYVLGMVGPMYLWC